MRAVDSDSLVATFTCGRCSRTTTDPHGDHWLIRSTPVIVAGITLGLCAACLAGAAPPDTDSDKRCGGACKGDFRPPVGTYFEAVAGTGFARETWACWDEACAEAWAEERGGECSECGHDVDVRVDFYSNGKRVRR